MMLFRYVWPTSGEAVMIDLADLKRRLLEKTVIRDDGCWEFVGGLNGHGYGSIWSGGSRGSGAANIGAHVASYMVHVGPVPAGLGVLHSCSLHGAPEDRRWCINPTHLRAGTPSDNVHDTMERGDLNVPTGERNGQAIFKEAEVGLIRYFIKCGWSPIELAKRYNVVPATIYDIKKWVNWPHVPAFQPIPGEPLPTPPPIPNPPTFRRYTERTDNER